MDMRIVRTFCVGFHRSLGCSPDWGSSVGGWRIDIHTSPFLQRNISRCESQQRSALTRKCSDATFSSENEPKRPVSSGMSSDGRDLLSVARMGRWEEIPYQLWSNHLRTTYQVARRYPLGTTKARSRDSSRRSRGEITVPFVKIRIFFELDCETFDGFFLEFGIFQLKSFGGCCIVCSWWCVMGRGRGHTAMSIRCCSCLTHYSSLTLREGLEIESHYKLKEKYWIEGKKFYQWSVGHACACRMYAERERDTHTHTHAGGDSKR